MRSWMYGMNSYYKKAAVYLEEAPWWVFAVDRIVEFLCDMTPPISLPKIQKRLKKREEIEFNDGNKLTTLRDWYGDLNQLFHCLVHMPIFYFCQKKIKCRSIDMDYDKAREIFYEKPKPNKRNQRK